MIIADAITWPDAIVMSLVSLPLLILAWQNRP